MDILTVTIPELMPQSAVDAGLSAFRCGNCGNHIEKSAERFSSYWLEVPVLACKTCGDAQAGCITVAPSSAHLLQPAAVKESIWYHATYVEDWFEKVSTGHGMKREAGDFLYIHVGNEDASRDLADSKYFTHPVEDERIMLYQLKVKTDAELADHIFSDIETWWDYSSVTEETRKAIGGDAVRYLNRWESPGSISLLVDARQLELVSVEQLHDRKVLSPDIRTK
jgi:hypothetical protein